MPLVKSFHKLKGYAKNERVYNCVTVDGKWVESWVYEIDESCLEDAFEKGGFYRTTKTEETER